MTIYTSHKEQIKEALDEMLHVASHTVKYKKQSPEWPTEGCLGYPAAIILFSIADSLGSYLNNKNNPGILIDGKLKKIKDTRHHFYVFNHEFYNLNLSLNIINRLYDDYRSKLIHNLFLPYNRILNKGQSTDKPFEILKDRNNKEFPIINVDAFYSITEVAVGKFKLRLDEILDKSDKINDALKNKIDYDFTNHLGNKDLDSWKEEPLLPNKIFVTSSGSTTPIPIFREASGSFDEKEEEKNI